MNQNAADFLWDDSLGCGLQQALFDAVGKANGRARPPPARDTRSATAA